MICTQGSVPLIPALIAHVMSLPMSCSHCFNSIAELQFSWRFKGNFPVAIFLLNPCSFFACSSCWQEVLYILTVSSQMCFRSSVSVSLPGFIIGCSSLSRGFILLHVHWPEWPQNMCVMRGTLSENYDLVEHWRKNYYLALCRIGIKVGKLWLDF